MRGSPSGDRIAYYGKDEEDHDQLFVIAADGSDDHPDPEPADLDGDGFVTFADLLLLLDGWGPCPPNERCVGDVDCDGEVDFTDLLLLLDAWS